MKIYASHFHKHAQGALQVSGVLQSAYSEILHAIELIDENEMAEAYTKHNESVLSYWSEFPNAEDKPTPWVSLSHIINERLGTLLGSKGWDKESPLFNDKEYLRTTETKWRLDFSKAFPSENGDKSGIAVEVAFNHGEAIAWNLLKPVIAAERNHVKKGIDIGGGGIGVIISASQRLKKAGLFDNAVGTYEKFLRYLPPMEHKLTVPLVIIGLDRPQKFFVEAKSIPKSNKKKYGVVTYY